MPVPETNLRIFVKPSMEEIVFPDNSATFVDYKLEQIDEGTQIVRDVNGNLRDLSNPAFRKYILSLSCTDNRLPPLAGLWAGDVVDVELPGEIAERGATPSRTAVAGTITVAGGYVRYRPRLTMMVRQAPALSGVEWRGGAAGWSFELEEANGAADVPVSSDSLTLAPRLIEAASIGDTVSINYNSELTKFPTSQTVTWAVVLGALPPGLSLNAATGVVSGTISGAGGGYAFALQASSLTATTTQTYVFDITIPTISTSGVALQNYTVGTAYSINLSSLVDVTGTSASPTFALTLGALPSGLSLSGSVLSGTPTGYGAFAATFSATLPTGQSTEVTLAFFAQMPDGNQEAIFSGGTSRAWTDDFGVSMVAADLLASGSFVVTTAGLANLTGCATGGGGGNINNNSGASCGGGGAGQFLDTRVWLAAGTYTVSIGATSAPGTAGNSTTITGPAGFSITLLGGGAGAGAYGPGGAGASGGGGSWNSGSRHGGAATSIETGTAGGNGHTVSTGSGGGGGFASPGEDGNTTRGGAGGGGVRKKLWTWLNFCGGGGGGGNSVSTIFSVGRNGGGNGGTAGTSGGAATANTGSGGGGGGHRTNGTAVLVGGSGGSGRLIVWGRVAS